MIEAGGFEKKLDAVRPVRSAEVRVEGEKYIYDFNPALPQKELEVNPEYSSLISHSLAYGGFKVKVALTPGGAGHGFVELAISRAAPREDVAALFDRLRSARIADIQLRGESYPSKIEHLKPRDDAERAILLLTDKQRKEGGNLSARVEFDGDRLKRAGYALSKEGVETAFISVPTAYSDPATITTTLTSQLNAYRSQLSRGQR